MTPPAFCRRGSMTPPAARRRRPHRGRLQLPMLERAALRIGPFHAGPRGRYRVVRDAGTSDILGHAFRKRRWGWLAPRTDVIYEEPDGSLLASVRRTWWLGVPNVMDADQDTVAAIRHRRLT